MRTIHIYNLTTRRITTQYSEEHFHDAMQDIEANGFKAIEIKFDADGDVVIGIIPIL